MVFKKIYQSLFPGGNNLQCQSHLMFLGFFGTAILYILRFNLSVAIVGMVGNQDKSAEKYEGTCPVSNMYMPTNQVKAVEYDSSKVDWDEETIGRVHGSFFYGYLLTNFIGGTLADRIGGHAVFGGGILLTSLLAFLLPSAALHSELLFCVIRLLQGMTEGVTFPSMNSFMSNWVQPSRRAYFITRFYVGVYIGPVFIMSIGGWMNESYFGWPAIFHLSGILGLVWSYIWFKTTSNHPASHPYIRDEEKWQLINDLKLQTLDETHDKNKRIPWKYIFTSPPFLATIVTHFAQKFGFYFLLTELPTYLFMVHHFDFKHNGLVSSLPYLSTFFLVMIYSSIIHSAIENNRMTVNSVRVISTVLGCFVPMLMLMLVPLAGCETTVVVILLCVAVSFGSCSSSGFICSFQDLAPKHSGTLCGISNTVGTIPGFLAPIVTAAFISYQPIIVQWNKVFFLSSALYFIAGAVYLKFMSTEVQPWNFY